MIRLLVADDQNLIRQALEIYLKDEKDLEIVSSVDNGMKAIEQVQRLNPDIAIIDLEMPGIDGLTTTKIIVQSFVNTKVIVLSSHGERKDIYKALQLGAKGYVLKNISAQELANVIRSVHRGYLQLGPGLHEEIFTNLNSNLSEENNFQIIEQKVIDSFEKIKQEFKQNFTPEYESIWKQIAYNIEQEIDKLRHELQLETKVNLNDLKLEVEEGLKVFQQKVVKQMENDWDYFKSHIDNQGLNNNFQELKMMRMQLLQLKESYQKTKRDLGNLRTIFIIMSLLILLALLIFFL